MNDIFLGIFILFFVIVFVALVHLSKEDKTMCFFDLVWVSAVLGGLFTLPFKAFQLILDYVLSFIY